MHIDLYVYLQDYWWISMQKTSRGEKSRTCEMLRIQSEPVGPGNLEGCCCSEMAFQLFPMQLPCGQHAGPVTGSIPPCSGGIFLQPHRKLRWAGVEGQDHRAAGGHASCCCQQVPSAPLALSVSSDGSHITPLTTCENQPFLMVLSATFPGFSLCQSWPVVSHVLFVCLCF